MKFRDAKKNVFYILVIMLIGVIFVACSDETIQLKKDSLVGYNWSDAFLIEEEKLIDLLEKKGEVIETIEDDVTGVHSYKMVEELNNLSFVTILEFNSLDDDGIYKFTNYSRELVMDEWPSGEQAIAIQRVFDKYVEQYGEPEYQNHITDMNNLFDESEKIEKDVAWRIGEMASLSFVISYDQADSKTVQIHIFENSDKVIKLIEENK